MEEPDFEDDTLEELRRKRDKLQERLEEELSVEA
jgi:hypothetical protein